VDASAGFDLAELAVKAVYRDGLGLGPATALTPLVLERFGCTDAVNLMHEFTRRGSILGLVAHLQVAPLLLDVAEAGDEVAGAIVAAAGSALGDQARVSAERVGLGLDGTPVVLTGGVLQHPSKLLSESIMARLDGAVPVRPTEPPLVGALLLAYDRLGLSMDDVLLGGGEGSR
jgi:N-acetylglucosamine kinase-like BadF-type ATPase